MSSSQERRPYVNQHMLSKCKDENVQRVLTKNDAELAWFRELMKTPTTEWPDRQLLNMERRRNYLYIALGVILSGLVIGFGYPIVSADNWWAIGGWLVVVHFITFALAKMVFGGRSNGIYLYERIIAFGTNSRLETVSAKIARFAPIAILGSATFTASISGIVSFSTIGLLDVAQTAVATAAITLVGHAGLVNLYKH